MLISNEWLKEYVTIDDSVSNLAERITRTGIEVDDLIDYTKDIKNLVVGFVKSKEKHPDADKLNVCQVDIGEDEPVQIVCGAPNVDAGQYVIVAKVGGRLPGGIKIKRAKLRGERSEGMILFVTRNWYFQVIMYQKRLNLVSMYLVKPKFQEQMPYKLYI